MSQDARNAFDFSFFLPDGRDLKLSELKGNVLLIVNTASKCGFTKQYKELQHLYDKYKNVGLVIIAVPCNDFGGQEPDDNEQILQFCKANYGITFPIVKKEVILGSMAHPFYAFAKNTLGFLTAPKWNFHKYLIDRHGNLVNYFYSQTKPESPRLIKAIEKLLS